MTCVDDDGTSVIAERHRSRTLDCGARDDGNARSTECDVLVPEQAWLGGRDDFRNYLVHAA